MNLLEIFVIHSKHLTQRKQVLESLFIKLNELKDTIVNVKYIDQFDIDTIQNNAESIQAMTNYDKLEENEENEIFNNLLSSLSFAELSRLLKHKVALERINEAGSSSNDVKQFFLVLEDDIIFHNETIPLLQDYLDNNDPEDSGVVFTGLPRVHDVKENNETELNNVNLFEMYKVIPSIDSYFVDKNTASELLKHLNIFKWRSNVQMSYILSRNTNIKSSLTKNIFIEGSKSGAYLSSIYPNNHFLYNKEYSEVINMLGSTNFDNIEDDKLEKIETLISQMNQNHPETHHILGVLSFMKKQFTEARDYFMTSLEGYVANNGVINRNSQLLQNLIKVHEFIKDDVTDNTVTDTTANTTENVSSIEENLDTIVEESENINIEDVTKNVEVQNVTSEI